MKVGKGGLFIKEPPLLSTSLTYFRRPRDDLCAITCLELLQSLNTFDIGPSRRRIH
jgi:hypothetical protein